jgi:MinD superfamily P-loop ATPase
MRQVVFISGKGGTGKSTVVASLSRMVRNKALADCDVDAPNLHMLVLGIREYQADFSGAKVAVINPGRCLECGTCRDTCRFDAIREDFTVVATACEGCGACMLGCPADAIQLTQMKTGETYVDDTNRGTFSHAQLDIGSEGSGKLVTEVKKNMQRYQKDEAWALVDGSPGIGCVVIASMTGADAVVAVCEPTQSGKNDLVRVLQVAAHFGIPAYVCINKYDLNDGITGEIEEFCRKNNITMIGRIPYEPAIVKALQAFQTPVEAGLTHITDAISRMWDALTAALNKE